MQTVDIHSHLHHFSPELLEELDKLPDFPTLLINCALDATELKYGELICEKFKNIRLSAGLHPQIADVTDEQCIKYLDSLKNRCDLVAIGEIGYDIYHANPSIESQKYFFKAQLTIAKNKNLPVIIHCRNGFEELFDDLKMSELDTPVILHGYSGGFKFLDQCLKSGYYISFGTPLVYEQSRNLRRIAELVPMNKILTETDSPFNLFRHADYSKDQNIPNNIVDVYRTLADVKKMNIDELCAQIYENACSVFILDLFPN